MPKAKNKKLNFFLNFNFRFQNVAHWICNNYIFTIKMIFGHLLQNSGRFIMPQTGVVRAEVIYASLTHWGQGVSLMLRELSEIILRKYTMPEYLWWDFQAETLYVCPKHGFGHMYKVSAWNFRKMYDLCNTQISR